MKRIHHNTVWLMPAQAAQLFGYNRNTFRIWAKSGLIKVKENPRRPKCGNKGWGMLYNKKDIEQLLGIGV